MWSHSAGAGKMQTQQLRIARGMGDVSEFVCGHMWHGEADKQH